MSDSWTYKTSRKIASSPKQKVSQHVVFCNGLGSKHQQAGNCLSRRRPKYPRGGLVILTNPGFSDKKLGLITFLARKKRQKMKTFKDGLFGTINIVSESTQFKHLWFMPVSIFVTCESVSWRLFDVRFNFSYVNALLRISCP